jgi:hypothetical protein
MAIIEYRSSRLVLIFVTGDTAHDPSNRVEHAGDGNNRGRRKVLA